MSSVPLILSGVWLAADSCSLSAETSFSARVALCKTQHPVSPGPVNDVVRVGGRRGEVDTLFFKGLELFAKLTSE